MLRRGCAFSALLALALLVAYFVFFTKYFEWPGNLFAAFFGSLSAFMLLAVVGHVLWGWGDRRAFARAIRHAALEGGQLIAVAGAVQPLGGPIVSPFSGRPCVAYEYEISSRRIRTRTEQQDVDCAGFAMTPCAIASPQGSIRLLGFPMLTEFSQLHLSDADARERAGRYVGSTNFETLSGVRIFNIFSAVDDALVDEDGMVRKDFRMTRGDIPVKERTLSERIVGIGETVCAVGLYDAERHALKPRGTTLNRLWPGDIVQTRRRLFADTRKQITTALVIFLIGHGMLSLAWYLSETRHRRESERDQAAVITNAIDSRDLAALERAVRRGANPNARDVNGVPALLKARDAAAIQALVRLGAEVDISDNASGETALIRAARLGYLDAVEALLAAGANMAVRTANGATALSEARRGEHADVVERLRRAGAPDAKPMQAERDERDR